MRPDGNGGRVEALVLGRGQFVGERAVINNRLRSADCVAQGTVQVRIHTHSHPSACRLTLCCQAHSHQCRHILTHASCALGALMARARSNQQVFLQIYVCVRVRAYARVAPCVPRVLQVVVMRKRDFMELDNPLLAWMLDYDAVTACLRPLSIMKGLKQEQMEAILDRFDAREELTQGQVILKEGDMVSVCACVCVCV